MKTRKCFRIRLAPMGKMLPLQSCLFSAIYICSSAYEMHIGLFRNSKLLHSLFLRFTVACWNSLRLLSSSAFTRIYRRLHLHTGTSTCQDGICTHGITIHLVVNNRNDTLAFAQRSFQTRQRLCISFQTFNSMMEIVCFGTDHHLLLFVPPF